MNNTGKNVYKLYYFNYCGIGEPIRYLLSYCGIPFDDLRFIEHSNDWLRMKPEMPMEQVPVLEICEVKYHEHLAICRYIAKKNNLVGSTDEENLLMDAVVDDINYIRTEAERYSKERNASKKTELRRDLLPKLSFFLGKFESQVAANNGFFFGSKISWVDIYYAAIIESMSELMGKEDLNKEEEYPKLRAVAHRIRTHMMIAPYIKNRPKSTL